MFARKELIHTARILLLGAPLMLGACTSDFGPYPMPTGYHYHDRIPPTPPGPEPVRKKIEHMRTAQSVDKNGQPCAPCAAEPVAMSSVPSGMESPAITAAPVAGVSVAPAGNWNLAAADLTHRLATQFGIISEPVFINPASLDSPHELGLERALRAAMMTQGYKIAQTPGQSPFRLDYTVSGPETGSRTMVRISLKSGENTVSEQSGLYEVGAAAAPRFDGSAEVPDGVPLLITPE